VRRYNDEGVDGMGNKPKGRPKRALTAQQEQEVDAFVSKGPEGTLVRWRCVDVQREIEKRFGVVLHERTVGKLLRKLGFRWLSVRPINPEGDLEDQETLKKLCCAGGRNPSRWRARQNDRVLVPRRSAGRPKRYLNPYLGQARHAASYAA
jgi:transposase